MTNTDDSRGRGQPGGDLAGLSARFGRIPTGRGPAPVDDWHPPFCGDIDMRIDAEGVWSYGGTPIGREAMVKLFASILRREPDGRTVLVTPVEMCAIRVDDVPFVAVEMKVEGGGVDQRLVFRTNVDDVVTADAAHPLRFSVDPRNHGLKPYLTVRGGLEARLARPVLYDLVELGDEASVDGHRWFGVWSGGRFWPILPVADIEAVA
ncbi:DUF1285 domain-containing protein [Siculibacillus lacustris]|uniref:DUF1285 domain-containing protein n=1 Tax=Siculibacillus lacustris TaxID=1549641 RepID=A0A4Q9VPN3_9HYPH|nr:DUF1285 domain-containing protein [Siculibacillus lacustris]TBW37427.1 DUF1285 domain-containing protein [Siculibacillus lacustris]